MEAMWMLAGRDDGAFLDFYIKDFSKRFGKDGVIMDAYGQRWKYGNRYNQLDEIIAQLRNDPTTRQCVLQMWGAGRDDLRAYSAKPCNLVATFRVVAGRLDMSVFNRSNDVIWGCCGANAVHFPLLQEYIAARLEVEMGHYWQISTNLHLYTAHLEVMENRISRIDGKENEFSDYLRDESDYEETQPLVKWPRTFDEELLEVMRFIDEMHKGNLEIYDGSITNPFLSQVVLRMAMAHYLHKNGAVADALDIVESVPADDWRTAGEQWINRRYHGRGQSSSD
jgi:hypothetical protein